MVAGDWLFVLLPKGGEIRVAFMLDGAEGAMLDKNTAVYHLHSEK